MDYMHNKFGYNYRGLKNLELKFANSRKIRKH